MKKTLLAIILGGVAFAATNASANTGTINFKGKVTSATCTINPSVSGATVTSIDLGTASLTSDATAVNFELKPDAASGADCLTKTNAQIEWSGPMDNNGFTNTAQTNAAQGFFMNLRATNALTGNGAANIKNSYTVIDYNHSAPITSFNYTAQLKKNNSAQQHQAGIFTTAASFNVTYL
ncbi:fimbrial protein [Escherichia coli]|uniref:fimbrial protein n=1 Tax=Escherichia coli TaxID=562 RepID=UPI00273E1D64|nr:fimbrial protein [Escherichia coli]